MTTATKTALAIILRQVSQGIYTKEEGYHLITELYMRQLNNHNF
jgi:hypothetical protein